MDQAEMLWNIKHGAWGMGQGDRKPPARLLRCCLAVGENEGTMVRGGDGSRIV